MTRVPDLREVLRNPVALVVTGLVVLLLLAAIVGHTGDDTATAATRDDPRTAPALPGTGPAHSVEPAPYDVVPAPPALARKPGLPGGGLTVFGHHRFLVAYYGTAQTGAMGVLGATDPATMQRRLMRAARPFREGGERIQPVYELIVTVADRSPGATSATTSLGPWSSGTCEPPTATARCCCSTCRPGERRSPRSRAGGRGR